MRRLNFFSNSISLFTVTSVFFSSSIFAASGKPFNPDLSINFLGLTQQGARLSNDRTIESRNGTRLQEAEIQAFSDVDPYFKANALFSISPNATEYGISPEEVYLETTFIPSVTLKAGKFKAALGKHNALHTHAFPFIDAPLIHDQLLGSEGLNEAGLSAAWMMPTSWFSELTVQALSNSNSTFFNSPQSGDFIEVVQYKSLWDLSDETTLEWTFSGAQGPNQFSQVSTALGSSLVFKWRPSEGGKYRAFWWATEYLEGNRRGAETSPARLGGLASWVQYQFAERWWLQGRYEYLGLPHSEFEIMQNKQSLLLGFFPSEFSGLRLQVDRLSPVDQPESYSVAFQYNVTIGAHPAHSY